MFWRLFFEALGLAPFAFVFWPKDRVYRLPFKFGGVTLSRFVRMLGRSADPITVKHEGVHQVQIRALGPVVVGELRFFWRWFRRPQDKLRFEAEAFAWDMDVYISRGHPVGEVVEAFTRNYISRYDDRLSKQEVSDAFWRAYNFHRATT